MKIGQIKKRIAYGDYQTLSKMLGISSEAAKKRFQRGDKEAASALTQVIEQRENLIKEFQSKKNKNTAPNYRNAQ